VGSNQGSALLNLSMWNCDEGGPASERYSGCPAPSEACLAFGAAMPALPIWRWRIRSWWPPSRTIVSIDVSCALCGAECITERLLCPGFQCSRCSFANRKHYDVRRVRADWFLVRILICDFL